VIRILTEIVIPLVLPIAGYAIWLHFARRRAAGSPAGTPPTWQDAPWTWLAVAGILLAALSVLALGLFGGAPPGARYVPPHVEDGQVVPGHTE
jgi:hypothetical protein